MEKGGMEKGGGMRGERAWSDGVKEGGGAQLTHLSSSLPVSLSSLMSSSSPASSSSRVSVHGRWLSSVSRGDSRASWFVGDREARSLVGGRRRLWAADGGGWSFTGSGHSSWLSAVSCHVTPTWRKGP